MNAEADQTLPARLEALFRTLDKVDEVAEFGSLKEPEARTLAYSLVEIAEGCERVAEQLDALTDSEPGNALGHLEEVREELRHILYHIQDSRFLRVIASSAEPE